MISPNRQEGVTLIALIFVVILLAGIIAAIVSLSAVQHTGSLMSLREAQGVQAARSGLERGVYEAVANDNCPAGGPDWTFSPGGALGDFTVQVDCTPSGPHRETGDDVTVYFIQSEAEAGRWPAGGPPTPDHVFRQARSTVHSRN